ncbi:glycosyltransferase [Mesorhizobium sp. M0478]|uniref:glycosyltransferase n=1 Tax=Mesorhizobium sp. M0478 TaxID=2956947 RepID=UPI003334E3F6
MEDTSGPFELPRVAVVITCFNYRPYVEQAIRSVLAQTYRNWECVIVDDASTDGSADHVRQLLRDIDDPRLRLLARTENGGQTAGFRDGFAATDAPFVAFLDADDVWLPDFLLAHLSAHLNTTHSAALSSSDVFLVDGDGTLLGGTFLALRKPRSGADRSGVAIAPGGWLAGMAPGIAYASEHPVTYFAPAVTGWLWSQCSAIMYRRGALEPVLSFPFKAKVGTDYLTATLAHQTGGSLILSEGLGLYRLHGSNLSTGTAFAGGNVRQTPAYRSYRSVLAADAADYLLANSAWLSDLNGRNFIAAFLTQHVRQFPELAGDPRLARYLTRGQPWRRLRLHIAQWLQRLGGRNSTGT